MKKKFSVGLLADLRGRRNWFYVLCDKNNKVIQSGKEVEGDSDRVFLVVVPTLPEISPMFDTSVVLSLPVEVKYQKAKHQDSYRDAKALVNLRVHLNSPYFDPQEVVDKFRATSSLLPYNPNRIDLRIGKWFEEAAMESEAVRNAFFTFLDNGNPLQFLEELSRALREIKFDNLLSNISAISVELNLKGIKLTAKEWITYEQ